VPKLIVLYITAFIDMIGLVMIIPLLPFYATSFGANAFMVGFLISSFSIAQLLVAPLWGRLSDKYGRRPMIIGGLILSATAYVVFAFAHSLVLLLLCRVIQGMGGGTIGVVQAYVADSTVPEQRTKTLGTLSAVTSGAAMFGPTFGSVLTALWGRMAPGLAAAALSSSVAVFAWKYLRESHELRQSASHAKPSTTTSGDAIRRVLFRWREPAPKLIWIYTIAIGAFYGVAPTLPLLLTQRFPVTEQNVGYFVTYLGGMGLVVRALVLGRMVDWLGEMRLAQLGVLCLATGLTLVSASHTWLVLGLALTLMPIGTAFIFPSVTGMLSRVVAGNERGLYMGVQATFGGVSRVAFPIAAGALMDVFNRGTPFWMAGVLVLVTLPLTGALRAPQPHP
jgi:MFS family permease